MLDKYNTKISILRRCLHILGILQKKEDNKWNAKTITSALWKDKTLFGDYEVSKDFAPDPAAISKNARLYLKSSGLVSISQGKNEWELKKIPRSTLEEITFNHSLFTSEDFHRKRAIASLVKRTPESCLWVFTAIHFARIEKKKIRFNYIRSFELNSKTVVVHPYFIILTNYNFYLFGKQDNEGSADLYLLNKIKNLEILEEIYKEKIPSPNYILDKSISGAFIGKYGLLSPKEKIFNVKIKFNPAILDKIEDLLSNLQNIHISEHGEYYEASFQVFDDVELCKQLFYFGSTVEIIEPKELRITMKEMLEDSLGNYQ